MREAVWADGRLTVYLFAAGTEVAAALTSFPQPWPAKRLGTGFAVGPDQEFAVFMGEAAACALRPDGSRVWQLDFPRAADMASGSVAISRDGRRTWLHVTAESTGEDHDHWLVVDADGTVLAQTTLPAYSLGSVQYTHPDGVHIGLSCGEGQDGSKVFWGRLDGAAIRWWQAEPDYSLTGLNSTGDRYLTIWHLRYDAAVYSFPDCQLLGRVASDAPPRGNDDPDGITVGSAFEANGGTIKDAAGNDALTTLKATGLL